MTKIYPVKNVRVRKVKVIQRPKIDATKLAEMHENDKRILLRAENKKTLKRGERGDKKKPEVEDQAAVNLLSRE